MAKRREIERHRVADIYIGTGRRSLCASDVETLAQSLSRIGLQTPIHVRIADHPVVLDGEEVDGVPVLIAGAHRLAAAKSLGWEEIDCIVIEATDVEAELWEIAENLHRADLSKEERDRQIRRYAELLQSQQNASIESKREDRRGHRPQGVASKIAAETGLSKDTVRRALASPKSISPPPIEPASEFEVSNKYRSRLAAAWNAAPLEDREWFREWIDTPVFDKGAA